MLVEGLKDALSITANIESIGDKGGFKGSDWAGTKGKGKRLEAFKISNTRGLKIQAMGHFSMVGDTKW